MYFQRWKKAPHKHLNTYPRAKHCARDMQMVRGSQLNSCFVSFHSASSHKDPAPHYTYHIHPSIPSSPTSWDILGGYFWNTISVWALLRCCSPYYICTLLPSYLHPIIILGLRTCGKEFARGRNQPRCLLVLWERPLPPIPAGKTSLVGCTPKPSALCNGHLDPTWQPADARTQWKPPIFGHTYIWHQLLGMSPLLVLSLIIATKYAISIAKILNKIFMW